MSEAHMHNPPSTWADTGPGAPRSHPPALPARVLAVLGQVSRAVARAKVLEGFLLAVLYLTAMLLLRCLLDRWLDFPRALRIILLLGDATVLGWLVWSYGIIPLRRRLGPEHAALRIEKAQPFFRSSLISCVQLCRAKEAHPFPASWLLPIIALVERQITQAEIKKVVPLRHLKRPAAAAAVLLVTAAGAAFLAGDAGLVLLARYAGVEASLPTATRIESITRDLVVPIGSDAVFEARASGQIPREGHVEVVFAGGEVRDFPVSVLPGEPGLFRLVLQNIQSDLSYRFILGDGRGPAHQVTCQSGPVIEDLVAYVEPPAYTGSAAFEAPPGGLSVPEGSQVTIRLRSSEPLESATLLPEAENMPALEFAIDPGTARNATLSFLAADPTLQGFTLPLRGTRGAPSLQDTFYRFRVIPDEPPTIRLLSPAKIPDIVTPEVRFDLVFEASDDYGVSAEWLCSIASHVSMDQQEADTSENVTRTPLEIPRAGAPAGVRWSPSRDANPPQVGQTVTFWLEAADANDFSGPGIGRTVANSFRIVTPEEKLADIQHRFEAVSGQVERLKEQQDRAADQVGRVLGLEGSNTPP